MTVAAPVRTDRIPRYTLALSLIILPFLVIASILLYLLPSSTDIHFAWTIRPDLTAMFLGSAYLGGIWFFLQVLRTRRWHRVRYGFPAVVVFASLLGAATLLHLDRFHPGHISFVTWLTLYLTTPVLTLVAIVANRGLDSGTPEGVRDHLPWPVRIVIVAIGSVCLTFGSVLFARPELLIDNWAWTLTPLTARVVGAILTLPGMVNIWMLREARWSAFRGVFQAQLFSLAFILLALVVARGDLDLGRPWTPVIVGGIVVSAIAYGLFYIYFDRRTRAPVPPRQRTNLRDG